EPPLPGFPGGSGGVLFSCASTFGGITPGGSSTVCGRPLEPGGGSTVSFTLPSEFGVAWTRLLVCGSTVHPARMTPAASSVPRNPQRTGRLTCPPVIQPLTDNTYTSAARCTAFVFFAC